MNNFHVFLTSNFMQNVYGDSVAHYRCSLKNASGDSIRLSPEHHWCVALKKCILPSCIDNFDDCFVTVRTQHGSVVQRSQRHEILNETDLASSCSRLLNSEAIRRLLGNAPEHTLQCTYSAQQRRIFVKLNALDDGLHYQVTFSDQLNGKLGFAANTSIVVGDAFVNVRADFQPSVNFGNEMFFVSTDLVSNECRVNDSRMPLLQMFPVALDERETKVHSQFYGSRKKVVYESEQLIYQPVGDKAQIDSFDIVLLNERFSKVNWCTSNSGIVSFILHFKRLSVFN